MVVSSVHIISEATGGPQMIETYQANLEALNAKKCGTFLIECDTYYSNAGILPQQKILNLITSSEYPQSAFALIDDSTKIVADSAFEKIISSLSNCYTPKKMVRMEVRGQKWQLGDFIIKLGSCTMGANFKAVLVEIEYGPSSIPSQCWDLIKEMGRSFIGPTITKPHQHLLSRFNELCNPVDTIHQYNDLFNQIKKQTSSTGPIQQQQQQLQQPQQPQQMPPMNRMN